MRGRCRRQGIAVVCSLTLEHLRDFVVHEKVHEQTAITKYGVNPVDSKWIDTDTAFER